MQNEFSVTLIFIYMYIGTYYLLFPHLLLLQENYYGSN